MVRASRFGGSRGLLEFEGCEKIPPEFQEIRLGGRKKLAHRLLTMHTRQKNTLHYIWGLNLDERSKCSV